MPESDEGEMRVGMISQWYPPEKIWVPQAVANAIRASGYHVQVITGTPHYPTGAVEDGYSALRFTTEVIDGIVVRRSPEYPYRGTGPIQRMAGYLSFALSSSCTAFRRSREFDLLFVYSSPATSALPAILLRFFTGKPYVLQVQDIWPDSVMDSGFVTGSGWKRCVRSGLDRYVRLTYDKASQIVVITDSAKSLLMERGVPEDKLTVIYNWTSDPRLVIDRRAESLKSKLGIEPSNLIFLYAGAIGGPQELDLVVSAFGLAGISNRASLVIVGSGVKKAEVEASAAQVDGVYVIDQVPISQAAAWLHESDVGVVALADTELHRATFPSKIQFICGVGKPLLVRAPGDASDFVNMRGIGFGTGSGSLTDTVDAFRTMAPETNSDRSLERMGYAARQVFDSQFSEKVGASRINSVLKKATQAENGCSIRRRNRRSWVTQMSLKRLFNCQLHRDNR